MVAQFQPPSPQRPCARCAQLTDEADGLCATCRVAPVAGQAEPAQLALPRPALVAAAPPPLLRLPAGTLPAVPYGEPAATGRRNRIVVGLVVGILAVALVGAGVWGASTKGELDRTTADLAAARGDAVALQVSLDAARSNLLIERQKSDALTTDKANLETRVASLNSCMGELQTEATDFQALSARQGDNFNAAASGSTLATARTTQTAQLLEALDDYYKAYSAAFDGKYATANSWVAKGNEAFKKAADAAATVNSEIKQIDAATTSIDQAWNALMVRIAATTARCGGGPAPGTEG